MKRSISPFSRTPRFRFFAAIVAALFLIVAAGCTSGTEEITTGSVGAAEAEGDRDAPATASDDAPTAANNDAPTAANDDLPGDGETEPVMEETESQEPVTEPTPPPSDLDAEVEVPPADIPDAIEEETPVEPEFNGEFRRVQSRDDLLSMSGGDILELVMADDSTVLVRFESGPEGCDGAQVSAAESDSEVRITLHKGLPPEAMSRGCAAVLELHEIAVSLAAPLGERSLIAEKPDTPPTAVELSLQDYIGLPLADAEALAETSSRPHRVVWRDGEGLPSTDDYSPRRLNFRVQDGIVIGLSTDAGETAGQ